MSLIWFDPESAASTFSVTIGGSPRSERGELSWGILATATRNDGSLPLLKTGDALEGTIGRVSFCVGDPYPVKGIDGSNDPSVGWIDWAGDPDCAFFVSLRASIDYFFVVRDLAGRGALPNVLLHFKDGCGITFDEWDNIKAKRVPITQYSFNYEYSPGPSG